MNQRKLTTTVEKYSKTVLSGGAKEECRGTLIAVEPEDQGLQQLGVVGGATYTEGIYHAIKAEPNNPHCQKLITEGLSNTLILPAGLSEDDLVFVKPGP